MTFAFVTGSVAINIATVVLVGYFLRFLNATRGLDSIDPNILPSSSLLVGVGGLLIYGWLMLGTWMTRRSEQPHRKSKLKNDEKPAADPLFPYPIMTQVGLYCFPLWALVGVFVVAPSPNTKPDVVGLFLGGGFIAAFAYGLFFPGLSFLFGKIVERGAEQIEVEDGI